MAGTKRPVADSFLQGSDTDAKKAKLLTQDPAHPDCLSALPEEILLVIAQDALQVDKVITSDDVGQEPAKYYDYRRDLFRPFWASRTLWRLARDEYYNVQIFAMEATLGGSEVVNGRREFIFDISNHGNESRFVKNLEVHFSLFNAEPQPDGGLVFACHADLIPLDQVLKDYESLQRLTLVTEWDADAEGLDRLMMQWLEARSGQDVLPAVAYRKQITTALKTVCDALCRFRVEGRTRLMRTVRIAQLDEKERKIYATVEVDGRRLEQWEGIWRMLDFPKSELLLT